MSNILITGGAGFIASHLAERFLSDGHNVVILDNLSTGCREYIPEGATFRLIDIKDESSTVDAIVKAAPDFISHHAAHANVRSSIEDPVNDAAENIIGGLNVLKGALEANVKRIIFSSTGGAIYGSPAAESLPVPESHPVLPESPYAAAKLAMEHYLRVICGLSGVPYVILRYSNVYGPRQVAKGESGVVAIFTQNFIDGIKPMIFGKGTHTRDYVYIKDVVDANVAALSKGDNGTFNIGTSERTDVNEIFHKIKELTGSRIDAEHSDEIPGEVEHIALDIGKASEGLGWTPKFMIDDGLPETIEYYKSLPTASQDD